MSLDIRIPIGGMFAFVGLLLAIYGLATHGDPMYARSLGYNVNALWGLVMLIFGGLMLYLGLAGRRARGTASGPP